MSSDILQPVLSLAILAVLSGFTLPLVANMCGTDAPSFSRAVVLSALAGVVAFLSFDLVAYGLVVGTRDVTKLVMPPGYSYLQWLQEPLSLRWQVLGLLPVLRYILLGISVCVGGILYVLILHEHFRISLVVFLVQWTLNLVGLAVVTFALGQLLTLFHRPESGGEGQMAARTPGSTPAQVRSATRTAQKRQRPRTQGAAPASPPTSPPAATPLQATLASHDPGEAAGTLQRLHARLDELSHQLTAPYEQELHHARAAADPYLRHLPGPMVEFLDDGGWWLVLLLVALAFVFWLLSLIRRTRRALRRRRRQRFHTKDPFRNLRIELGVVSDAFTDPGPQQITVRGASGRLRLVVLAPSASYVGELLPEMAENLLDYLRPGLGELVEHDQPRVVVWPRHPSEGQFRQRFRQLVEVPDAPGRRSHWVLLSGSARLGRPTLFVGLAVFLDQASHLRELEVDRDRWSEVLGTEAATAGV